MRRRLTWDDQGVEVVGSSMRSCISAPEIKENHRRAVICQSTIRIAEITVGGIIDADKKFLRNKN